MSRATDLGDALVSSLNGHDFSQDFTAVRKYRPIQELKELATLHVTVLVPTVIQEMTARKNNRDTITADIVIQKQTDHSNNSETDPLIDLAEEIAEYVRDVDFNYACWLNTEILTFYDMEFISDFRLFCAIVRVLYHFEWRKS